MLHVHVLVFAAPLALPAPLAQLRLRPVPPEPRLVLPRPEVRRSLPAGGVPREAQAPLGPQVHAAVDAVRQLFLQLHLLGCNSAGVLLLLDDGHVQQLILDGVQSRSVARGWRHRCACTRRLRRWRHLAALGFAGCATCARPRRCLKLRRIRLPQADRRRLCC